jgi:hypothetical protein
MISFRCLVDLAPGGFACFNVCKILHSCCVSLVPFLRVSLVQKILQSCRVSLVQFLLVLLVGIKSGSMFSSRRCVELAPDGSVWTDSILT